MLATLLAAFAALMMIGDPVSSDAPRFDPVADDEFPIPDRDGLTRGHLIVSESGGGDRVLRLPVAIVHGPEGGEFAAPVVFLSGGPGAGSLAPAQYPGAYPWTAERDFVVYARRGSALADPVMECPQVGAALAGGDAARQRDAVIGCARIQVERGVDLNAYNTAAHVRDLEALRIALGYERLSLFALSYGTRLALSYAREHPERVESMVLDSPLPHAARYDDALAGNVAHALRMISGACVMQPACDAAYPELEARFFDALAARGPDADPSAAELVLAITPGSAESLAETPALMHAVAEADFELLAPRLRSQGGGSDFSWGVRLSVWCSESLPYSRRAGGVDAAAFAGIDGAVFKPELCALWPVQVRPEAELDPPRAQTPTLVIAGGLDVLTPPAFGVLATATLPQSALVVAPAGFHTETTNWDSDGCALQVAASFLSTPQAFLDAEAPPGCLERRGWPDFTTP
jgi:pimeloyl-ACP methyl ester carboxylesterase